MAPAATNGDAAAAVLDSIKPPAGVIIPPPGEIREVIEKTAGYVVRGGVGIEERLRENHGSNPKFSFVVSKDDAYNPYYEWRKEEYRAGRVTSVAAGRVNQAAAEPVKEVPKGPPKPADFHFSARMPLMSQKDLEIVRLTALFVARNGRQFMTSLSQREAGNPQFQFLIPNHTFHNFFQHMIDQYTLILKEGGAGGEGTKAQEARLAELRKNVENKYHMLERAKQRAEWAKWEETKKQEHEDEEVKKKEEFQRINWTDFVIVETIVFTDDDDKKDLPPPTTLNDIQYASLEEKNKFSINSLRIEEAFPFEDTSYNAFPPKPPPQFPVQPAAPAQPQQAVQNEEEIRRIREREQNRERMQQAQAEAKGGMGPMKIKENYVPRAAARAAANKSMMALCPNCKQEMPVSELEEHMRIELLDPRWKEQKAKADSRFSTTNLGNVDIASNIKRLASQTGEPVSEEELARRKRAAISAYDGGPPQPAQVHQMQTLNVDEQIKALHQKFAGDRRT